MLSGCTTTSQPTVQPTTTPGAGTTVPSTTPAQNVPAGMTTANGVTTITGSGDQTVQVPIQEGGAILRFKYLNNFDITISSSSGISVPLFNSGAAGTDSAGYKVMSRVDHWYSDDVNTFAIKANGPYQVDVVQLPAANPVSPPQTYTGSGWQTLGPVTLNAGTATFTVKCPDTRVAGFTVKLIDGTSGSSKGTIAKNYGDTGTFTTGVDTTSSVDVPADGAYIIDVECNGQATWEISVTQ